MLKKQTIAYVVITNTIIIVLNYLYHFVFFPPPPEAFSMLDLCFARSCSDLSDLSIFCLGLIWGSLFLLSCNFFLRLLLSLRLLRLIFPTGPLAFITGNLEMPRLPVRPVYWRCWLSFPATGFTPCCCLGFGLFLGFETIVGFGAGESDAFSSGCCWLMDLGGFDFFFGFETIADFGAGESVALLSDCCWVVDLGVFGFFLGAILLFSTLFCILFSLACKAFLFSRENSTIGLCKKINRNLFRIHIHIW